MNTLTHEFQKVLANPLKDRLVNVANILVLGGSSLVGRYLMPKLVTAGYRVVAPSRNPPMQQESDGLRWINLDLGRPCVINDLPEVDIVVSMLPIWMTSELCKAMNGASPLRVVAFSSTSALTKSDSEDVGERELSKRLLAGEADLLRLAPDARITIFRPTMIYGGRGDRNVERVAAQLHRFRLFPLVGHGVGLRQPVHADDLATAVTEALTTPTCEGKSYELSGAEVLSFRSMIERIGCANDVPPIFVNIPLPIARAAIDVASILPRFRGIPRESVARMTKDMVFDHGSAKQDFGFSPREFEPPIVV
jgi:uncharacterized protein YbjT (DUF2867 family)